MGGLGGAFGTSATPSPNDSPLETQTELHPSDEGGMGSGRRTRGDTRRGRGIPETPPPKDEPSQEQQSAPSPPAPQPDSKQADRELRQTLITKAVHINTALNESRFSGRQAIAEFATFGTSTLQQNLRQAATNVREADAFDRERRRIELEAVRTMVERVQAGIAPRAFFGEWTYSTSNVTEPHNGQSSCTMTINYPYGVGFNCKEFRSLTISDIETLFPTMQDVTVTNVTVSRIGSSLLELSLRGGENSIRELVRNSDNFRARVWFTNLKVGEVPKNGWGATPRLLLPRYCGLPSCRLAGKATWSDRNDLPNTPVIPTQERLDAGPPVVDVLVGTHRRACAHPLLGLSALVPEHPQNFDIVRHEVRRKEER